MKITDAFRGEHGVFYAMFAQLERTMPAADNQDEVQAGVGLLAASLASHARIEDQLLFTTLEEHLGQGMGPIAVMRLDHDEIEGNLARLPEMRDPREAASLLLQTVAIARQHFAKEEQVLYTIAERALALDALEELGSRWAEQRGVVLT